MSGLIGLVGFPAGQPDRMGKDIFKRLCRFPWDTWEWWVSDDGAIALGRVDIGVFNPQPQPVKSNDGKVFVFLSGELYRTGLLRLDLERCGYQFTRGDDPELVLYAYLEYGAAFVSRLEGAFHLVILDLARRELLIVNDRFGLRPLYWTQYQGRLVFAPEVKALLVDPALKKQLDIVSVAEMMKFQRLLGEKTFFENISLFPPATQLRYHLEEKTVSITQYWSFAEIPVLDPPPPIDGLVQEATRLFLDAVNVMQNGQHKVGLYLSGGLDSRLIAGCLVKYSRHFPTATYGKAESIDVLYAKRVAKVVESEHHFFEFVDGRWVLEYVDLHLDLTEGHHSWIHSHGISTLGQVRRFMDVNLTGWGVDTGLGGYDGAPMRDAIADDQAFYCYLFNQMNQQWTWPGFTEAEERLLYTTKFSSQIQGLAFESLKTRLSELKDFPYDQRIQFLVLDHNRRLTQNHLKFYSSHFENRCVACDYRFFDFIYSFRPVLKSNRRLQQRVIEQVNPELAMIPQTTDGLLFTRRYGRRIAHHAITRLKQRINRHIAPVFWQPVPLYADYENWLRHELKDWATGLLLDGRLESRGMFNMDLIRSLLNRHFSGRELHTIGKIAPLMTFEMMMQAYFD